LLTSLFPLYLIDSVNPAEPISADGEGCDPSGNFSYATAPHITLGSIAQNANLDPLFEKHDLVLDQKLSQLNRVIDKCGDSIRASQVQKLADRLQDHGVRATTDADCRRWLLPGTAKELIARAFAGKSKLKAKHVADHANLVPPNGRFQHWHVPFDTDPDWPEALSKAVLEYRTAWRAKMDEVNECIAANADQEVLVDQPRTIKNVVRVSGPFTVEGVVPEELNIGEEGLFDGTPDEELQHREIGESRRAEPQNLHAYLHSMVAHLQSDGVTFPDNKNPQFSRLEALFDSSSASAIHAEGVWEDGDADGPARVGVGFGPQYGPVTAMQVEELIREASRRGYDELVIAGFSFDAEAHAIIQEDPNPKVRAHMAQIRPDLNAGMEGLLKDTPRSQLFTVFGTPSIEVAKNGCEYTVTLEGVDIYDPVRNVVQATGASKVAAWFLDSDFNGRAFCITQAFFPDQDAWAKLAKALKDVADPEAFAAFKGTTSLPFEVGEHRQVAVKVIDPRGNEVMTIHRLEG
jgi:adenine-specific DNA-methyltransferase